MGMGGSDGCRNDTLLIVTELKYIYIYIYIYIYNGESVMIFLIIPTGSRGMELL